MNNGKQGTRERILWAAQDLFLERGFHATALQEIADRVGITKPALYYHFGSKAEILGALLDPLATELDEVLADATEIGESGGRSALRRRLMTGWLDVFLRYRGTLGALMRELAATQADAFERLLTVMENALDAAAGPNAEQAERIAVAQAISAITDPIALLPNVSNEELREHLLTGVWRLLPGTAHAQPATREPRAGGRPQSLSADAVARARELHAAGKHTATELAAQLGVSRATLYRHLKTR